MIKALLLSSFALSFGLSAAQETCQSLLQNLTETLNSTESLIQTTKMKAGFLELASFKALFEQTPEGVDVTVLEQSGRQPQPDNESFEESEPTIYGPFNPELVSCEEHTLKALNNDAYELELIDQNDETPIKGYTLNITLSEEIYKLELLQARVKANFMPATITMETHYSDWVFK